jgi:hypothetical protein
LSGNAGLDRENWVLDAVISEPESSRVSCG